MEGSQDVFSQGVEIGEEDPFAGSDFGDFEPPEGAVENGGEASEESEGPLPIINREGERLDEASGDEAPEAGTESEVAEPADVVDPTSPAESAGPTEPDTPDPADATQTVSAADEAEKLAENAPPASSEPQAATDERESAGEGEPTTTGGGPTEAEPQAEADSSGKKTKRNYVILRVDGPGKFSQVTWYEKGGRMVAQGTEGAKKRSVAQCRGTDEALRIGYQAVGAPDGGAKLIAVAALYFQVKEVKPLPPEPEKQRLQIR